MIKTRLAATAALLTFGLAAFAGILAATAHADTDGGTTMTPTAEQSIENARTAFDQQLDAARDGNTVNVPAPGSADNDRHQAFPETPHGPYTGKPNSHDRGEDAAHPHSPQPMQIPSNHH
jgi:hypothetical protein